MQKVIEFRLSMNPPMFEVIYGVRRVFCKCCGNSGDRPLEALEVLWKAYHKNLAVLKWINKVKHMKRAVKGLVDIESYALYNGWAGDLLVSPVAATKWKAQTAIGKGKKSKGDPTSTLVLLIIYPTPATVPIADTADTIPAALYNPNSSNCCHGSCCFVAAPSKCCHGYYSCRLSQSQCSQDWGS
jgi:hypothetical protein